MIYVANTCKTLFHHQLVNCRTSCHIVRMPYNKYDKHYYKFDGETKFCMYSLRRSPKFYYKRIASLQMLTFELKKNFFGESINWCVSNTKFPDYKMNSNLSNESVGYCCFWCSCVHFLHLVTLSYICATSCETWHTFYPIRWLYEWVVCQMSAFLDTLIKLRIVHLNAYTRGIWTIDLIKLELELINREIRTYINSAKKTQHKLMSWIPNKWGTIGCSSVYI